MWETVKNNHLKNKGKNIWVYDINDTVFAGVEAEENTDLASFGLEKKIITLNKFAYCVHKGPYQLIKETGSLMRHELSKQGSVITFPYIEIYGHWNADESKLETELLMCLE